ncbi:hypothetical protein PG997_007247 [Apiospora hydei]|uniref:Polyketide synthase n=1 Tax=Apiospora hydei TaxID=1337664 RepID=A0ABR1WB63_9PEZI
MGSHRTNPMTLYLFGDQTFDVEPHIGVLLQEKDDLFLQTFLRGSYNAIRLEIYKLPPAVRGTLPRFSCLEDLASWRQNGTGERCIALDMAMTTLWQLGIFILQGDGCFGKTQSSIVAGLCTGNFAAAAVSCSRSRTDLIATAVDAVVASFRTGIVVADVAQRVTISRDGKSSWSFVVEGTSSASLIQNFNDQSTLPSISRPYISAYLPNAMSISGPPNTLARLMNSDDFKPLTKKDLPIFGPYHAAHLYSPDDPTAIVSGLRGGDGAAKSENIPFLSTKKTSTETRYFSSLLREAVVEVLMRPLQWSALQESLESILRAASPHRFSIVPIGSAAHQLFSKALRETEFGSLLAPTTRPPTNGTATTRCSPKKPRLAIVGMSGRFPDAKNNEAFWDILRQGLDVHKTVPPQRWDAGTHVDTSANPRKNTSATPFGCWLQDPEQFDARFFNISPKEAAQIDPAQRLALMTAYEAIEGAGIVSDATPSSRPDRIGVFYGVTSNDWMETNSAQDIDAHMIPGGNRAFIPGRINYFFKFSGPSYAVDTACSSSLAAIHLACNALWCGDVDTAVAGGTNVVTNPDFTAGLDRGHFLSRTGNCKTFDDGADGYCRGEGVATVVLKRLDDALAENDPVLGVILGAATNHSAESESITRPHVGAQRTIFRKLLNETGVDPYSVSYIEMHGTGTQAGDAAEMTSVLDVFAPHPAAPLQGKGKGGGSSSRRARGGEERLYLGSAKANIGHGEAASGASGLIKVLMMMEKNLIVPHCGIKTKINHNFPTDLEERQVRIALEPTAWQKRGEHGARRVLVNNFSAAGGNTALLLEDAPCRRPEVDAAAIIDSRKLYPVAVSAKVGASLQGNLRSLLAHLEQTPEVSLGELSYTTTSRRTHHPHRTLFVGSTVGEICDKIKTVIHDGVGMTRPMGSPRVIFSFTGQGAQYPGMARQLLQESSVFAGELRRLDQIATSLGFPSLIPFVDHDEKDKDAPAFSPCVVQLASVCVQMALVKLWASWDILPAAVVGHSLGEYAALNAAGVLSDVDAVFLVGTRARLLEEKCTAGTHAMLVVYGPVDRISEALRGSESESGYETACINSPTETVLAGPRDEMPKLQETLKTAGMSSTLLQVPFAFHSSQVDVILSEFQTRAQGVTFSSPKIPVIRPLDGTISDATTITDPEYLVRHSREAVNMLRALTAAQEAGLVTDRSTFLEIGSHPAICKMVKSTLGSSAAAVASLQRGARPWDVLARSLKTLYDGGANIRWAAYQQDFPRAHKVVPMPSYAWDLKPYWIQYVHDWSLRKGEPAIQQSSAGPRIESTTIHSIVSESGDSKRVQIVVEADIARKDLSPLVQGHEVDGIPLCTPSVYADMALTLGAYLRGRYQPNQTEKVIDVSDMTISKALILNEQSNKQLLQLHAEADWATQSVTMKFMSFKKKTQELQEHARCIVRFKPPTLQPDLQQSRVAEVQARIQALREGVVSGATARYSRAMVYRAIRPLARFHDDYRAIDGILLDSGTLEAACRLSFGGVRQSKGDAFHTHPAVLDALTQVCGFAMNCNDGTDLDVEVFMNHGWGSLQLFEPVRFDGRYTTYTRMEPGPDKLWRGDVLVFDRRRGRLVAHLGQIAIQGVPRRVLKVILSLESGRKGQHVAAAAAPRSGNVEKSKTPEKISSSPAAHSESVSRPTPKQIELALIDVGIQIIAEESGVAVEGFTDDTVFSDMGIDSLLGMTISARFQDQLDVDLDFNGLFFEYPTVKDLKAFLAKSLPVAGPGTSAVDGYTTPDADSSADGSKTPKTPETPKALENGHGSNADFTRALQIIAEESGVEAAELGDDTCLADCGVDSLLSLIITSRFRDELDLAVENESLFLEQPTVGDLKRALFGAPENGVKAAMPVPPPPVVDPEVEAQPLVNGGSNHGKKTNGTQQGPNDEVRLALLDSRKQAVDQLVETFTEGFSAPTSDNNGPVPAANQSVVLVTGGTGSLGSNLVYHLAQLDTVKTVVCLNRRNREADPATRQFKAMREKGIRFPDALKLKLLILQTDSALPRLGLEPAQYDALAASVTHLVHQAWPMSATRALPGFASEFRVMRNLIDFARDAASATSRPAGFRFSFEMVSSIGVVGLYGQQQQEQHDGGKAPLPVVFVPETSATIDSVLPNGYSEAKWGCERMLEATLHRHPARFRTMTARLGQIAGSKTSGYWNPMEHFGFLVKSSCTLGALPDVEGKLYWTPVNDVAATLADLPWPETTQFLQTALRIPRLVPFPDWLARVRQAPQRGNPALILSEFLESNYLRMSCGGGWSWTSLTP